ncbi:MAG: MaoC family dehydratase [Rhodospirillaceae bacterium]|jgi:acyl dehydratase|nr:MaoC family dehydratase [Rhodospirillaceae bacterium]MBT6118334.1 MaoC family dehydratase [Rhodospirillaceae bacterium]
MAEEGFTIAGAEGFVGREIGVSPWRVVTQAMIDGFADSTADTYWIHTDPARAASGPFGGTIAHGFLTLSLLSVLLRESGVDWGDEVVGLNYGLDRVRFLTPVRAGERVRARIVLTGAEKRAGGGILLRLAVTVEIENQGRPALVADWLNLFLPGAA